MPDNVIEIQVPIEEIEARRERVERTMRFEPADRIPAMPGLALRYLLPKIGISFHDYFSSAETMLRAQILYRKWQMENVRTDQYSITGPWVGGWVDFQNINEQSALGARIVFPNDDLPCVAGGCIADDRDLDRLEQVDIINSGLHGKANEFRREMMAVAEKYPVRFQGGEIFYPGANPALTSTTMGPFSLASDLMPGGEIFLAISERPEFARRLLSIITKKVNEYLDFCWKEMRIEGRNLAFADDTAAYLSPDAFREWALPYDLAIRDRFNGRIFFHMCGKTNHLLPIFVNDLRIDVFNSFGYEVDLDKVTQIMGGRVVLVGNVNPLIFEAGIPADIKAAARQVIAKLAPCGGFILQEGSNIPPSSPIENVNALYESVI